MDQGLIQVVCEFPGGTQSVGSSQQTQDIEHMLDQCWASLVDVEPTLVQHSSDVSCLLHGKMEK